jgi:maleylacetate reductase
MLVHESPLRRVVFGAGAVAAVPGEVERLAGARALVIGSSSQAPLVARVRSELGTRAAGEIVGVRVHVPGERAEAARERARSLGADCLVSIGGGSAVGLAKAVALTDGLPIVAVPTTYAGSELTAVWGTTANGRKRTGRSPAVVPRAVVYDPELTYSLPPAVTAASGLNALAHCVEALWGPRATPFTDACAVEGMRLLVAGLRGALARPLDPVARADALAGAWLAGESFAAGGALHHTLCHVLGGRFDLPHAELHAALLPYAAGFLLPAAPAAARRIADVLGADDAAAGLFALQAELPVPGRLADLGLSRADARTAASLAAADVPDRPRRPDREELERLLAAAIEGTGHAWPS